MTDRRLPPESVPNDRPDLEARLAAWFSSEVRRAQADLSTVPRVPAPLVVTRRRPPLPRLPLAFAALLAIVVAAELAVAGLLRFGPSILPGVSGTASPQAGTPAPSSEAVPTSSPPLTLGQRYSDGIPDLINGEKVVRPPDLSGGRPAPGVTRYLLGGWSPGAFYRACPAFHAGDPAYVLTPTCGGWPIGDTPLVWDTPPALSVNVSVITDGRVIPGGPVVLRVHVDDPRAAQCPPERRPACRAAIVVDSVVWVGQDDSVTTTAPLRADQVADRLLEVFPDLRFLPRDQRCGNDVVCTKSLWIGNGCNPGWPIQTWETNEDSLGRILVFPSTAARRQTQPNLAPGGLRGTDSNGAPCSVSFDAFFASDWVAVDNVLIDVHVVPDGPTAAQRSLIDQIRKALSSPS